MTAVLTVVVIVLALAAWVSAFWILPSCNISLFRYRLWRLRDRVMDEMLRGEFDDPRAAARFIRVVEATIENSRQITTLDVGLMYLSGFRVPKGAWRDRVRDYGLQDLGTSDRVRLEGHIERRDNVMAHHLAVGTPSGWISMAVLLPVGLIALLFDWLRGNKDDRSPLAGARERWQREFDIELAAIGSRGNGRSRQSLHQNVC